MSNLGKKASVNLCAPLAKDVLPKLAIKATSSILDKFERKVSRQEAFYSNQFIMGDIIKIVMSLEDSSLLLDGTRKTVKHEKKN